VGVKVCSRTLQGGKGGPGGEGSSTEIAVPRGTVEKKKKPGPKIKELGKGAPAKRERRKNTRRFNRSVWVKTQRIKTLSNVRRRDGRTKGHGGKKRGGKGVSVGGCGNRSHPRGKSHAPGGCERGEEKRGKRNYGDFSNGCKPIPSQGKKGGGSAERRDDRARPQEGRNLKK